MLVGVLSDTHIPGRARQMPPELLAAFVGVDLILHAGDLVSGDLLDQLRKLAPVEAVAGNNDPPPLALGLGFTRELNLGGYRVGLTHGHIGQGRRTVERALSHFPGFDCVVFGHTHIPYCQKHGDTLAFNPGSATDRRFQQHCSYGFLHIQPDGLRAELCLLAGK